MPKYASVAFSQNCNSKVSIAYFSTHIIGSVSWANGMNFQYHIARVTQDLFRVHFLPIGKLKIHPFLRAGGTQAKRSTKYGPNGLCVLTAISKTGGFSIFQLIKNEP